jgi:hypothetical protein
MCICCSFFYGTPRKVAAVTIVNRLSDTERFLFILGVSVQSSIFFYRQSDSVTMSNLYICTGSASLILQLVPIVTFLGRILEIFTPIRTFVIVVTGVTGASLYSLFYFFYLWYNLPVDILRIAVGFSAFGVAIYIVLVSICMVTYCQAKIKASKWLHKKWKISSSTKELEVKCEIKMSYDVDEDFYNNYVPALHMMASLIFIGVNATVFFTLSPSFFEGKNYVLIFAEVIVLVTELRIRKNEVVRALVRVSFGIKVRVSSFHSDLFLSILITTFFSFFSLSFSLLSLHISPFFYIIHIFVSLPTFLFFFTPSPFLYSTFLYLSHFLILFNHNPDLDPTHRLLCSTQKNRMCGISPMSYVRP